MIFKVKCTKLRVYLEFVSRMTQQMSIGFIWKHWYASLKNETKLCSTNTLKCTEWWVIQVERIKCFTMNSSRTKLTLWQQRLRVWSNKTQACNLNRFLVRSPGQPETQQIFQALLWWLSWSRWPSWKTNLMAKSTAIASKQTKMRNGVLSLKSSSPAQKKTAISL